jgi:hypothetical protein
VTGELPRAIGDTHTAGRILSAPCLTPSQFISDGVMGWTPPAASMCQSGGVEHTT